MSVLNALIAGIIQGLTEFLPVSSDGHLTLYQHFTGTSGDGALFFTVLLHLGTLFAVLIAYYQLIAELIVEFFLMIWDIARLKFIFKDSNDKRKMIIYILIASLPLILVFLAKDFITQITEDNDIVVEGALFLVTALMLYFGTRASKGNKTAGDMRSKDAIAIGLCQALAPLPGVSRSGSTISSGLMLGFTREYAVAFSFILGLPAVLGATLLEVKDAAQAGFAFELLPLAVGIAASAIVGVLAIKFLKFIVRTDKLIYFAAYTGILGILTIIVGIYEHIGA